MRKVLTSFLISLFTLITFVANSQEAQVPADFNPKKTKPEDYSKYEKNVVECVNYLNNSAFEETSVKKLDMYIFILNWVKGERYISISIPDNMEKMFIENEYLLYMFIGNWAKYCIEKKTDDEYRGFLAGLKAVLKIYRKGINVVKDKDFDKLLKLEDEGKLEEWARKLMNKK